MVTKEEYARQAETLAPAMKRIALSILRSEADARDAVQQALVNVWAKRDTVDAQRVSRYLMRVVVNECRNIQRRRQRVFPVERVPERAYEPPDTHLRDAVASLPEPLRTPLLLRYMEGCSERETAQILSLTIPQVKSRLFRARKKLLKALDAEEYES